MSDPGKAVFLSYASPSYAKASEGSQDVASGGVR